VGLLWSRPSVEKLRERGDARRLVQALDDASRRDDAAEALASLGEKALDALLSRFQVAGSSPDVVEDALVSGAAMAGPRAVEPLLALLERGPDQAKERAMRALSLLGEPRAGPLVAAQLGHEAVWVRAAAVRALGRLPGSGHYELIRAAMSDPMSAVRKAAAEALGDLRDARALPALRGLWNAVRQLDVKAAGPERTDEVLGAIGGASLSPENRLMMDAFRQKSMLVTVTGSLAMLGEPQATKILYDWLGSDKANLRAEAATELGRVADDRAVAALTGALRDADPKVRPAAADALANARHPGAAEALAQAAAVAREEDKPCLARAWRRAQRAREYTVEEQKSTVG
jgi:HEAT repeat protein